MLYTKFNLEDAKLIWKQEAFEDGLEQGREEGMIQGIIKTPKEFNVSNEEIINKITKDYNISEYKIKKYL